MAVRHLTTTKWERLAPLGAFGFLGTFLIGAAAIGESTPSGKAPAEEIAAYFAEHQGAVFFNSTVVVLGGFVFFPLFLAALWRAIHQRTDGDGDGSVWAVVAMVAGVALLGPLLVQTAGWGAAALQAGEYRDPWVAAALMDLGNMGFLLFPIPAGLMMAATSAAAPPGLLPRWLVRTGRVLAGVCIVGAMLAAGLAPVYFVLFGLWLVAVATTLLRTGGPSRLVAR
jgi:hypothetical protein